MIAKVLVLLFLMTAVYSALSKSQINVLPGSVFDIKLHCKFGRNESVTLENIKYCCEVELKCLDYDDEGNLQTSRPEDRITLANIKKINDWRALNKTQAFIICAPVLNDEGAIQNWENDKIFRSRMTKTTVTFLVKNNVKYIEFFWNDFAFDNNLTQWETKRTIDSIDEACDILCDALYSKEFQDNDGSSECLVKQFLKDKKKTKVRNLVDCEWIFNYVEVTYDDGYSDTFEVGEPVINLKKVESCKADFSVITDKKVHCEFRRVMSLTLESIENCCEVVIRCLQYDVDGRPTYPEPEWRTTLKNIENINKWKVANKTQAVVICAPALNVNGTVTNWRNNEKFQTNVRNLTKPFLEHYNIKNLEIFRREFGLKLGMEQILTFSNLQLLEMSLGPNYDVFYDETYENSPNPETCLVQALEDKREAERERIREQCDFYLGLINSGKLIGAVFIDGIYIYDLCANQTPSKKRFEIRLMTQGFSRDQCDDLKYPKLAGYKDETFRGFVSGKVVENSDNVLACYLFIEQWSPDTSGKGKWFSPYWT